MHNTNTADWYLIKPIKSVWLLRYIYELLMVCNLPLTLFYQLLMLVICHVFSLVRLIFWCITQFDVLHYGSIHSTHRRRRSISMLIEC